MIYDTCLNLDGPKIMNIDLKDVLLEMHQRGIITEETFELLPFSFYKNYVLNERTNVPRY